VGKAVTPAKAGVQKPLHFLDSGFRRNDKAGGWVSSQGFIEAGVKWEKLSCQQQLDFGF
jgi:hypothetical protein